MEYVRNNCIKHKFLVVKQLIARKCHQRLHEELAGFNELLRK